jgi:nucleoside-diphosphate-sugar epimerase/EAL domain-containing protein (putative c-di-GMP-specific phosphodiesterase class I)
MARYLITGVAGFIGSWIARDLVARGETVRGIDNLASGSLTNLAGIEDQIEFLHADLRNPKAVEIACEDVDFIFHQAAIDSVQQSIDEPIGTSNINLDGTLHLIAAAQKNRVKRIVFAGSSAVYGSQPDCPITEDAPTNPLSPYAIQKLSCEQYLANAWELSGIETVSLRYFHVFGPRQSSRSPYSRVIAQFTEDMLSHTEGGSIIYGDGEQSRDFVYVSDVVNANILAMHAPAEMVAGKVFNIGSGRATTIRLTFEAIACMTGYTGDPRFVQARPGDIRRSVASLDAASQAFGYKPAISFADGLYKTITWYREQLTAGPVRPALGNRNPERMSLLSAPTPAPPPQPPPSGDRHINAQTFAEAVQNNELELFYQPILDLAESRIVGAEALLRWRYGHRLLTPAHFIHLAEEKGLTPLIGAWILDKACSDAVEFQTQLGSGLRLAINISPLQLEQRNLLRTVESALTRAGLDHACLDLEVTERTLVRDCASTQHNLFQLRRRGVRIAVDDFGTGYSNMHYLYRFPIDCIKIDQSFVQHKGHARVLDGIVAFARTLGVRTVAEGVETARQLAHVRASQCDEAQGFHIGRPVPASHFVQSVRDFEGPVRKIGDARSRMQNLSLPSPAGDDADETHAEVFEAN